MLRKCTLQKKRMKVFFIVVSQLHLIMSWQRNVSLTFISLLTHLLTLLYFINHFFLSYSLYRNLKYGIFLTVLETPFSSFFVCLQFYFNYLILGVPNLATFLTISMKSLIARHSSYQDFYITSQLYFFQNNFVTDHNNFFLLKLRVLSKFFFLKSKI